MMRSRLLSSPLFVLFVVAVLSIAILKPKIEEIMEARNNLELVTLRLERLNYKASFLKGLDVPTLKSQVELVVTALPSEKDIPTFLSTLDLLSSEASVSVVSVQSTPGSISTASAQVASENEGRIPLSVVMEGPFAGIKLFLARSQKSLPLSTVSSFAFHFNRKEREVRPNAQDIFGVVNADFSLGFHYQLLPKFLGKVSERIDKLTSLEEKMLPELSSYTKPPVVSGFVQTGRDDPFAPF